MSRDRPKFGYGVSAETTQKYGFGLVSVTAKRNGQITVSAETWPRGDRNDSAETSRNWISSVSCSDLQSDDVIFWKQWAGLTAWSESSQVYSASPPQPTWYEASRLIIKAGVLCTVLNQTTPYNMLSVPYECDSVLNVLYSACGKVE